MNEAAVAVLYAMLCEGVMRFSVGVVERVGRRLDMRVRCSYWGADAEFARPAEFGSIVSVLHVCRLTIYYGVALWVVFVS